MSELKEAVARGVALLNEAVPDWRSHITRPLSMHSFYNCVLGQVFGEYSAGRQALAKHLGRSEYVRITGSDYGFDSYDGSPSHYVELTDLWTAELQGGFRNV